RLALALCLWCLGGKTVGRLRTLDQRQIGLDAIITLLDDKEEPLRARALWVIESGGPKAARAVPALISRLENKQAARDWDLVANALGSIGPKAKPAVKYLVPLLDEANPRLRLGAAQALHRIEPGHPCLVPSLQKAIRSRLNADIESEIELLGQMGKHAR